MHELGITRNIVAIVCEKAGERKVIRINLEIGKLSAILPEAIQFCFDICCKNTVAEGAQLQIDEIPGRGQCQSCRQEFDLEQLYGTCGCGSRQIDCIAGKELNIKEMELS